MSRPSLKDKVLELVLQGKTNPQIAKIIDRKLITAEVYVSQILKENNVKNRNELIIKHIGGDKMLEELSYDETESGRSETLIMAIEKIEKLEKKLNIALSCLKEYADEENNWVGHGDSSADIWCGSGINGFDSAQTALKEIEDVE